MSITGSCECGREWSGHAEAHCPMCHLHFTSDRAFDLHLSRSGKCMDPNDIRRIDGKPTLISVLKTSGLVWMRADYRNRPEVAQRVREGSRRDPRTRSRKTAPDSSGTRADTSEPSLRLAE